MKKLKLYSPVTEEAGVIMVFTKMHEELGFKRLVTSSARGFDIDNINYKGHDVTVEFEYLSSNYIRHGHPLKMIDGRKYIVICWYDDCDLKSRIKRDFNKEIEEVICLDRYVEVVSDTENQKEESDIKYMILNYNPDYADNRSFYEWSNSNLYRLNSKFSNGIPSGSKVLIKQGDYIVGGFDVVRYVYIERLEDNELNLYKKLTDYPITLFDNDLEDLKSDFTKGHIFYDNFFVIDKVKVRFSEVFPDKCMSHDGRIYITKEEYERVIK